MDAARAAMSVVLDRARTRAAAPGDLLRAAVAASGVAPEHFCTIAQALLGDPSAATRAQGRSELNWNQSPLQLLMSLHAGRPAVRLLGDPGVHLADAVERRWVAERAMTRVFVASGAAAALPLAQRLAAALAPADRSALERYAAGSMWLGAALGTPGAAVYSAPDPDSRRWREASDCVRSVCAAPDHALSLIGALESRAFLLGVGLEGVNPSLARLKLYWRLTEAAPMAVFGIDLFQDSRFSAFLADVVAESVALRALNFSAAFDVASGKLHDVKLDVSWSKDLSAGLAAIARQAGELGLEAAAPMHAASEAGLQLGCIGFGLNVVGEPRLNTYFFSPSGR